MRKGATRRASTASSSKKKKKTTTTTTKKTRRDQKKRHSMQKRPPRRSRRYGCLRRRPPVWGEGVCMRWSTLGIPPIPTLLLLLLHLPRHWLLASLCRRTTTITITRIGSPHLPPLPPPQPFHFPDLLEVVRGRTHQRKHPTHTRKTEAKSGSKDGKHIEPQEPPPWLGR